MFFSQLGEAINQEQKRGQIETGILDLSQQHCNFPYQQLGEENVRHSSIAKGEVSIIEPLSLLDRARRVGVTYEDCK